MTGEFFFDGPNRQRTGFLQVIGLNPSTATETVPDRTTDRLKVFAVKWGFASYCMTNLFAFRSTDPRGMKAAKDPIGPDNMAWLQRIGADAEMILCAWGTDGGHLDRHGHTLQFLRGLGYGPKLHYLRFTKEKYPEHPLYLPGKLVPIHYAE